MKTGELRLKKIEKITVESRLNSVKKWLIGT